jgi:hypothetical protein
MARVAVSIENLRLRQPPQGLGVVARRKLVRFFLTGTIFLANLDHTFSTKNTHLVSLNCLGNLNGRDFVFCVCIF